MIQPHNANPDLERLHEIALPDPVSWTPQTVGWYVLAAVVVVLLVAASSRWWKRWRANRFRRQALAELVEIEGHLAEPASRPDALRRLPELLKRTAMSAYGRERVAELSGRAWLEFLNSDLRKPLFEGARGELLDDLAYAPTAYLASISAQDANDLGTAARQWIRRCGAGSGH